MSIADKFNILLRVSILPWASSVDKDNTLYSLGAFFFFLVLLSLLLQVEEYPSLAFPHRSCFPFFVVTCVCTHMCVYTYVCVCTYVPGHVILYPPFHITYHNLYYSFIGYLLIVCLIPSRQ